MSPRKSQRSYRKTPYLLPSPAPSTSSQILTTQARAVTLKPGLEGQDDNIDTLVSLYEEMQLSSVEAASADFFQFVEKAFYFATIHVSQVTRDISPPEIGTSPSPKMTYAEWKKHNTPVDTDAESPTEDTTQPITMDTDEGDERCQSMPGHAQLPESKIETVGIQSSLDNIQEEDALHEAICDYMNSKYRESRPVVPAGKSGSAMFHTNDVRFLPELKPHETSGPSGPAPNIWDLPTSPPRWDGIGRLLPSNSGPIIGFVYLVRTQNSDLASASGLEELSIGIILRTAYRGNGYARTAVGKVLQYVFNDRNNCHRVQALIPENYYKNKAMNLFTQLQFGHEGTRRRCFYSFGEWKDITCLGMLNTDWVMRRNFGAAPKSLWDEMFLRHDRERDELMRWEAREEVGATILHRTASMETIRDGKAGNTSEVSGLASGLESESEIDDEVSDAAPLLPKDKGKQTALTHSSPSVPSFEHRSRSTRVSSHVDGYESTASNQPFRSDSPALSDCSFSSASTGKSIYPPSSSSEWEMMDEDDYEIMSSLAEDDDDPEDEDEEF